MVSNSGLRGSMNDSLALHPEIKNASKKRKVLFIKKNNKTSFIVYNTIDIKTEVISVEQSCDYRPVSKLGILNF